MSLSSVYPIHSRLLIHLGGTIHFSGKSLAPGVSAKGRILFQPRLFDVVQRDVRMIFLRQVAGDVIVEFFRGLHGHPVVVPCWVPLFEDAFPIICDRLGAFFQL